jgi:hypothetical protein
LRQAYDYWQDQPGNYRFLTLAPEGAGSSLPGPRGVLSQRGVCHKASFLLGKLPPGKGRPRVNRSTGEAPQISPGPTNFRGTADHPREGRHHGPKVKTAMNRQHPQGGVARSRRISELFNLLSGFTHRQGTHIPRHSETRVTKGRHPRKPGLRPVFAPGNYPVQSRNPKEARLILQTHIEKTWEGMFPPSQASNSSTATFRRADPSMARSRVSQQCKGAGRLTAFQHHRPGHKHARDNRAEAGPSPCNHPPHQAAM